jgi:hypothetical protein
MDDRDKEQFHDDDVEITDLSEETETASLFRTSRGGTGNFPLLLERWLFRKRRPRQRFWQLATITGSVVLIVLIILAGSANTRTALITGIVGRQPTPTPTLFPGTDLTCAAGILVQVCQACRYFCSPPGFALQASSNVPQWDVLALIYSSYSPRCLSPGPFQCCVSGQPGVT